MMLLMIYSPQGISLFGYPLNDLAQWGIQVVNFFIFVGLLIYFTKKPLQSFFSNQKEEIKNLLARSVRDKEEGLAQLQSLTAKMNGLEAELKVILSKAQVDAEEEKARILAAAREEAEALIKHTRNDIELQTQQAQYELRALAAELAINLAQAKIKKQLDAPRASVAIDHAIQQFGEMK